MDSDKEFYLDLNKITLLGWESSKSFDAVSSMITAIKKEKIFSAVPVRKIDDLTYSLVRGIQKEYSSREDGGHHRALAHYLEDIPLKVKLSENSRLPDIRFPIQEIYLQI